MKISHIKLAVLVSSLIVTPFFSNLASATQAPRTSPVDLEGTWTYFTYAIKTDAILQDLTFPTTGKLTLLEGNAVVVEFVEHRPGWDNSGRFVGTMTPSGVLKLTLDLGGFDLVPFVKNTSGCTISGNFPVFYGLYDGKTLRLTTSYNSRQEVLTPFFSNSDGTLMTIDGPMHWTWIVDLKVNP